MQKNSKGAEVRDRNLCKEDRCEDAKNRKWTPDACKNDKYHFGNRSRANAIDRGERSGCSKAGCALRYASSHGLQEPQECIAVITKGGNDCSCDTATKSIRSATCPQGETVATIVLRSGRILGVKVKTIKLWKIEHLAQEACNRATDSTLGEGGAGNQLREDAGLSNRPTATVQESETPASSPWCRRQALAPLWTPRSYVP